jgi:hypothetical protein
MNYLERSEKRDQMKLMPGWEVHWACTRLVSSFGIFRKNSDELLAFLVSPPLFSFQFFPDEQARMQKLESDTEVLTLIHNYVASVNTLIDHFRRIRRKYLKLSSQKKYDKFVEKYFAQPRAQLIVNLRHFMLHVDLPVICSRVNLMEGSSRIALLPDKLLNWKGWKSDVKVYLQSLKNQKEYIMLEELVREYNEKTNRLSIWCFNEIAKCNYKDLEAIYKLNDEILESVKKDGLVADPLIVQHFTRGFRLTTG